MKKNLLFIVALISFLIISCKTETQTQTQPEPAKKTDISEFLGQWTIDVDGGGVAWLEVRQEEKYLDGDLLWIGGSVLPVSNVFLANEKLMVTLTSNVIRKRDDKNNPVRTQLSTSCLEIKRDGEKIMGVRLTPRRNGIGVDTTLFSGTLLPAVPAAPDLAAVKFGEIGRAHV